MSKKMKARIGEQARKDRIKKMLDKREEYINMYKNGKKIQIVLQSGNDKTGINCRTVSLCPIIDCMNCKECMGDCYDLNNDCFRPRVINDRARNSALHKIDIAEYWRQVEELVKKEFVMELRINVGGDLSYEDFKYVRDMAKRCKRTDFLFFTKSYDDINRFLDESSFPNNVKAIISRWCNLECDNKHNLPESHVLYEDGRTTAPEFGAKYCGGNCSACHYYKKGCWSLKNGESVVFQAH